MDATPLPDLVILLAAAVGIVTVFRLLRVSPVLGYLVAGAVIGPGGFNWVHDLNTTSSIAELGIVFLLFMIGLELSWDRLKAMRGQVFGIGTVQVLLTGAAFTAVAITLGQDTDAALVIGGGLALSSTALVLQVLHHKRELASQSGRLSLAILILQDLAVLPLLVLVPLLGKGGGTLGHALSFSFEHAVFALAAIIIVGQLVLRPLFRLIAKLDIHELFVAATLLLVLGVAWATHTVGLSMALGAFFAGLLVAETEFQHQVEIDVRPYKSLLMGLFFMTVGMRIDPHFILANLREILGWAVGLILLKTIVLYFALRAFSYSKRTATHTALLLAQGGEFGFILFGLAGSLGVLDAELVEKLLVVITLTMAATPLLDTLGLYAEMRLWRSAGDHPGLLAEETRDMGGHVVLAGYGRMGKLIADHLGQEKIPFIALDTNPREVAEGRVRHHPVYFGDAARADVLETMGIARARALVITLHDPEEADRLLKSMRQTYPALPIFVRARDAAHMKALGNLGATLAVPELQVSAMRLLSGLLSSLNRPEEEIRRVMNAMRE